MMLIQFIFRRNGISMRSKNLSTNVDLLRIIPDDIIAIIQSKLPTKDAKNTSILPTRWIHQGTSITNLDFDDLLLYSSVGQNILGGASFSALVNRVLILQNNAQSIERFQLSLYLSLHPTYFLGFIQPSRRKFKILPLIFITPADICLPKLNILFTSHIIFLDIFSIFFPVAHSSKIVLHRLTGRALRVSSFLQPC